MQAELHQEAAQLVNLQHLHIVRLYGVVIAPRKGRYELVMERLACNLGELWGEMRRVWYPDTLYRRGLKVLKQVWALV